MIAQQSFYNILILKYADKTSIHALIANQRDLTNYKSEVERFVQWCDSHFLLLNVKKTKELIFDFSKTDNIHDSIVLKGEVVEREACYKYLGVVFDENLDWVDNSKKVQSKVNQRLHFMSKVSKFHVDNKILTLFFESCISSVMSFCITAWGGNVRHKEKQLMNRSLKYGNKLVGRAEYCDNSDMFLIATQRKFNSIIKDSSHPLFPLIVFSKRSNRLIHIKTKTKRHFDSFLPTAVRLH